MKKYKNVLIGMVLFVLIFGILTIFGWNNTDNIWNYGCAHAIRMGELPYRDFNIVTTPLYDFLMSSLLFLHDSYFTFLVEQSLLCVFLFFLLRKMVQNKVWLLFPLLLFPIYYFIFPNYNFLVLLLLVLVLYLDKNQRPDSWIGVCLGLLILSKHTIGGVVFLLSLISTKSFSKSKTRVLFSFIPLGVFLLYLLFTGSFYSFLDLTVLGLFDFAGSNSYLSWLFLSIAFACFLYTIYSFCHYKEDPTNYYLLGAFTFLLPIVDMFHSVYLIGFFLIVLFMRSSFDSLKPNLVLGGFIFLTILGLNVAVDFRTYSNLAFTKRKYLTFNIADKWRSKYIDHVLEKYNSYPKSCMLSMNSMYFDIESGRKITFFDIPLYGNFGSNGLSRMKMKIAGMHGTHFFLLDSDNRQYVNELNDYVREIGTYQEKVEDIEIYYVE